MVITDNPELVLSASIYSGSFTVRHSFGIEKS